MKKREEARARGYAEIGSKHFVGTKTDKCKVGREGWRANHQANYRCIVYDAVISLYKMLYEERVDYKRLFG